MYLQICTVEGWQMRALNQFVKRATFVQSHKRIVQCSTHATHVTGSMQAPPPRACTIPIKNKTTKKTGEPEQ